MKKVLSALVLLLAVASCAPKSVTKGKGAGTQTGEEMSTGSRSMSRHYCTDGNYAGETMLTDRERMEYNIVYHVEEERVYVVHFLYDIRTSVSEAKNTFQATRGCYLLE